MKTLFADDVCLTKDKEENGWKKLTYSMWVKPSSVTIWMMVSPKRGRLGRWLERLGLRLMGFGFFYQDIDLGG